MLLEDLDAKLSRSGTPCNKLTNANLLTFQCPICLEVIECHKSDFYFTGNSLEDVTLEPKNGADVICSEGCGQWQGKVVDGVACF